MGLKAPSGKRRRHNISHIDSEKDFVDGGLLMVELKKNTKDYHHETYAAHFKEWLKGIFPKLKNNSVLLLDNAPYHLRRLEQILTIEWWKAKIIDWLTSKNINFEEKIIKAPLLEIVKREKSNYQSNVLYIAVDNLAATAPLPL
ncbi:hypothetical protein EVAR_68903_1 [Eumeta japonica]|uniref:Tc1-like transposase DDE domain-containing protein n=1 Tax=Eumeta variegata TaxID=151549 RepID=A0A4C1ZPY4_EUMVA|nr:hypothetical protein EVAR_68903_1 [Eumeta japonica]